MNYNLDVVFNASPTSLYWFGFLAADGCVKGRKCGRKILTLCLSKKDSDRLKKFGEAIGYKRMELLQM